MSIPYKKVLHIFNSEQVTHENVGSVKVQVLSEIYSANGAIALLRITDMGGFVVDYPYSLIKANEIKIDAEGCFLLTAAGYNAWFTPLVNNEYKRLSKIFEENFNKVVANSQIIVANSEFSSIHVSLLKSQMAYGGAVHYSLGALLNCWINSTSLEVTPGNYMINIGGSPLSGANKYMAWSVREKKFVIGSVVMQKVNWKFYFDVFRDLGKITYSRKVSNILAITNLFVTLDIEC